MENPPEKNESPKQVCTINVVFPCDSDENAIWIKKKISEAVSETPDARIDFRIMNLGRPRV